MPSPPRISALPPFQPDLVERAWCSAPHPTLPLLATAHAKAVTVFSLATSSAHSTLTGGHERSVRSVAWKPQRARAGSDDGGSSGAVARQDDGKDDEDDGAADGAAHQSGDGLCLVTASFDSTAALWRWHGSPDAPTASLSSPASSSSSSPAASDTNAPPAEWEFTLVLDGHDSELKSAVFSPSGVYLATCSRDKSVWIWEDVSSPSAGLSRPGEHDDDDDSDDWETVAVLNEHDADVKAVAWCPAVPGRTNPRRRRFGADALASASYDGTVRVWREDFDGDWVCVAVLDGHAGATVWGVAWEPRPRAQDRFPRLLSHAADGSVRLWELDEPDEQDADDAAAGWAGGSRIPNTMRSSLRERWTCAAVLPAVHHKDVYSVAWSARSGMVASVGSDGVLALYAEDGAGPAASATSETAGTAETAESAPAATDAPAASSWTLLARHEAAHGPYEINHVTWCPRHDAACENKGVEEMLVTTGDDGLVRPWAVQ